MYISGRIGKHILIPSELVLLRGVLDRLCLERQVAPDTDEGSDLALRVFYFYEQGVVDEEELFIAASGRRGRTASIERKLPGTVALAATSEASTAVQV